MFGVCSSREFEWSDCVLMAPLDRRRDRSGTCYIVVVNYSHQVEQPLDPLVLVVFGLLAVAIGRLTWVLLLP